MDAGHFPVPSGRVAGEKKAENISSINDLDFFRLYYYDLQTRCILRQTYFLENVNVFVDVARKRDHGYEVNVHCLQCEKGMLLTSYQGGINFM